MRAACTGILYGRLPYRCTRFRPFYQRTAPGTTTISRARASGELIKESVTISHYPVVILFMLAFALFIPTDQQPVPRTVASFTIIILPRRNTRNVRYRAAEADAELITACILIARRLHRSENLLLII